MILQSNMIKDHDSKSNTYCGAVKKLDLKLWLQKDFEPIVVPFPLVHAVWWWCFWFVVLLSKIGREMLATCWWSIFFFSFLRLLLHFAPFVLHCAMGSNHLWRSSLLVGKSEKYKFGTILTALVGKNAHGFWTNLVNIFWFNDDIYLVLQGGS